jgi:hypothetical protein
VIKIGALLAGVKYRVQAGERYGKGVVLEELRLPLTESNIRKGMQTGLRGVKLICDCGNFYVIRLTSLFAKKEPTRSCGCLKDSTDVPGEIPGRFLDKILVGDDCWAWQGAIEKNGYGRWDCRLVHRASYEFFRGKIPEGLAIDHLCKTRSCVKPSHLEPVTPKENNLRSESPTAINSRKTQCLRGHELSGSNLYISAQGYRNCRACQIIRSNKRSD